MQYKVPPQSGRLANDHLHTRLEKEGYYETKTTPGRWRHKWRPVMFSVIVDDFRVEYVGKFHADRLALVLRQYHTITIYWEINKYAVINTKWNYTNRTCSLTMQNYIRDVLTKYVHPMPSRPQLLLHKHRKINYGTKTQFSPDEDTIPNLDLDGIR